MTDRPDASTAGPEPPVAPQAVPVATTRHGVILTDEYAWLRDPNWQQVMHDPGALASAIPAHLENENAYANAVLAPAVPLQERLIASRRWRSATRSPSRQ